MLAFRKAMLLLLLLVLIYAIAWLPMNAYNVLNALDIIEFSQYRLAGRHARRSLRCCLGIFSAT